MSEPNKKLNRPDKPLPPSDDNLGNMDAISTAYMKASISIPLVIEEMSKKTVGNLDRVIDNLEELNGSLFVIAKYFHRKGMEEHLFTPEDIKEIDGDEDESESIQS